MANYHPADARNKYGVVKTLKGVFKKGKQVFYSVVDVLQEEAKCGACGCDPCLGYWTQIDVTTGEVVALFIDNGVVTTLPLEEAKVYLSCKQKQRLDPGVTCE